MLRTGASPRLQRGEVVDESDREPGIASLRLDLQQGADREVEVVPEGPLTLDGDSRAVHGARQRAPAGPSAPQRAQS